jgi:hypothetical protein
VWAHPAFHEPRAYWSGQRLGEVYIELSRDVPVQYGSAHSELASSKLSQVIAAACSYYEANGDEGFEPFVRARLKQAADAVRVQMRRDGSN